MQSTLSSLIVSVAMCTLAPQPRRSFYLQQERSQLYVLPWFLEKPIRRLPPGVRLARDAVFRDVRSFWGLTDKTSKFVIGSGASTDGKTQFPVSTVLKYAENWTRNSLVCCTRKPDQKHNPGATRTPPHRRHMG